MFAASPRGLSWSWSTGPEGLTARGVELELPVSYHLGGAGPERPAKPMQKDWGRMRAAGLELPGIKLEALDLTLALTPNRLWLRDAVSLPWWSGKVTVSGLLVDQPLSPDFHATCAVKAEGLDLAAIPGTVPLKGALGGRLEPVEINARQISAGGRLAGRLFDGELKLSGLGMELPFSPGREMAAEVSLAGVDLAQLSQALDIGRITGRLDARVSGLRAAYGQPVAFALTARSVPAEGVDQTVSLKAVNSISVIGTGSGLSGMGVGLLASLFKEFPYAEIGLSCTLKNDVFRVQGLIREDGVEYLVKRPPFMGINVVNRNPDNLISFSDMLSRLNRVREKSPTP